MALKVNQPFYTRGAGLYMDPYRAGEDERHCKQCGSSFVPRSRTQVYCKACAEQRRKDRKRTTAK